MPPTHSITHRFVKQEATGILFNISSFILSSHIDFILSSGYNTRMKTEKNNIFTKPIFRILLSTMCCALWGSAFVCIKLSYEVLSIPDSASQILYAGYRFTLAGIFTFIIGGILEKRFITIKMKHFPMLFGQGLLQTTIQYVFFYMGLTYAYSSTASIIDATATFYSIIGAHFLMKNEPLTKRKVFGCLFGFAGVIAMNFGASAHFVFLGEGFIVLSAMAYGISTITMKMCAKYESPLAITSYEITIGGVVLIIIGLLMGGWVSGFNLQGSLLLLYLALLSTVAFLVWSYLLAYNPVGQVAVFGLSIPLFGVLLSAIVLKENVFTINNLLALIGVCGGIYIVNKE